MFDRKTKSLKYKELVAFEGALESEKRGDPKNEGKSGWLYENKGRRKTACCKSANVIENKQVIRFFGKVDENKGGW